jgi:uncharacterized coiled-coil protein SlyX
MAAAPVPPLPDDVSLAAQAIEWVRSWGGPLFGGGGLGFAYWAGRKVSKFETFEGRIKRLEEAHAAQDVKIAELPTRADLAAAMAATAQQMQAGFAQLTQLIGARLRD